MGGSTQRRKEFGISVVMRGLDPRIHHSSQHILQRRMDCRVKPGNDEVVGYCR
jgi:hypothetical protein